MDARAWNCKFVSGNCKTETGSKLGNQPDLVVLPNDLERVLGLHHHDPRHPHVARARGGGHVEQRAGQVSPTHAHLELELTGFLVEVRTPATGLEGFQV